MVALQPTHVLQLRNLLRKTKPIKVRISRFKGPEQLRPNKVSSFRSYNLVLETLLKRGPLTGRELHRAIHVDHDILPSQGIGPRYQPLDSIAPPNEYDDRNLDFAKEKAKKAEVAKISVLSISSSEEIEVEEQPREQEGLNSDLNCIERKLLEGDAANWWTIRYLRNDILSPLKASGSIVNLSKTIWEKTMRDARRADREAGLEPLTIKYPGPVSHEEFVTDLKRREELSKQNADKLGDLLSEPDKLIELAKAKGLPQDEATQRLRSLKYVTPTSTAQVPLSRWEIVADSKDSTPYYWVHATHLLQLQQKIAGKSNLEWAEHLKKIRDDRKDEMSEQKRKADIRAQAFFTFRHKGKDYHDKEYWEKKALW